MNKKLTQYLFVLINLIFLIFFQQAFAGAQKEEKLSASVATAMRHSINDVNPPYLVFSSPQAGNQWFDEMDKRLSKFVKSPYLRKKILVNVQYESVRAGLDTQLMLGLIQVESGFRPYAISYAGARGLTQVMPFWLKSIGKTGQDLFDVRTNLRYGCTILRHYLNIENGNLTRALARYNGSLGQNQYPDMVLGAFRKNWQYDGPM